MQDPAAGQTWTSGDSDEALARAAGSDRQAFAVLYRRWAEPVYRYCYRRLRTREAAEDATSQTMTRAMTGIDRFRGGSFPAWLFTIARNVVISAAERSGRPIVALDAIAEPPDHQPGPEALAMAGDASRELYAALDALTDDQRQVIELRLADLTTAEIADAMGREPVAVRMLQHRAVRRLRDILSSPPPVASNPSPERHHA